MVLLILTNPDTHRPLKTIAKLQSPKVNRKGKAKQKICEIKGNPTHLIFLGPVIQS